MSGVKRYDCTNGGASFCQGCYTMTERELGDYVSSEDYDTLRTANQRLEGEVARLREALISIRSMTNADDPESYRCDDREGCLDSVYSVADAALRGNGGE